MKQAEFARVMDSLLIRRVPFAVATVVKIEGSSLGKPGFKILISNAGVLSYPRWFGSLPFSLR